MGWDTYICIEEFIDNNWICIQKNQIDFWVSSGTIDKIFNIEILKIRDKFEDIKDETGYPKLFKDTLDMINDIHDDCGIIYLNDNLRISYVEI